jgi:uncharacterized alpha/beta hydrolase family protein
MKKLFSLIVCLLLISLIFSCKSRTKQTSNHQKQSIEHPKPLMESKTDSLKNYLDEERARRLKK